MLCVGERRKHKKHNFFLCSLCFLCFFLYLNSYFYICVFVFVELISEKGFSGLWRAIKWIFCWDIYMLLFVFCFLFVVLLFGWFYGCFSLWLGALIYVYWYVPVSLCWYFLPFFTLTLATILNKHFLTFHIANIADVFQL